jgi:hypothetical protein
LNNIFITEGYSLKTIRKINCDFFFKSSQLKLWSVLFILVLSLSLSSKIYSQEAKEHEPLPAPTDKTNDDLNAEKIIEQNKPALISIWYHTDNYYSSYS